MTEDTGRSLRDGLSPSVEPASSLAGSAASIPSARPLSNAPEVRAAALNALADDCCQWGGGTPREQWLSALRHVYLNDNGYEIARDLERYSRISGIDAELVEILDGASSHLWDAHRDLVRRWVASNNIVPTLTIGDRIASRNGNGTISGYVGDQGCYLMVPDGEEARFARGGGVYVPYELASAIEARRAETRSGSVADESAVPQADAQPDPAHTHPGDPA